MMLEIISEQSCETGTFYPQFIDEDNRALREGTNLNFVHLSSSTCPNICLTEQFSIKWQFNQITSLGCFSRIVNIWADQHLGLFNSQLCESSASFFSHSIKRNQCHHLLLLFLGLLMDRNAVSTVVQGNGYHLRFPNSAIL